MLPVPYHEKMSCLIESIRPNASFVCQIFENVAGPRSGFSLEVWGGCDHRVQLTVVQIVLNLTRIQHIMRSVCKQALNCLNCNIAPLFMGVLSLTQHFFFFSAVVKIHKGLAPSSATYRKRRRGGTLEN